LNDLVDVGLIKELVPDALRVDNRNRTLVTLVEATCPVDSHLAGTIEPKGLNPLLRVGLQLGAPTVVTALGAALSLVDTEKYMVLINAHAS
jgi:hypothetical protein